jgi:hypothetical protein
MSLTYCPNKDRNLGLYLTSSPSKHSITNKQTAFKACEQKNSEALSSTHLEDVNRDPLTEPKQDKPTKTGMIQDMTPKW